MHYTYHKYLFAGFGIICLMLFACTKTVQIQLKNAASKLVIEGKILNTPGPYYVRLSKSTTVSATKSYPAVSGAVVKILDKTSGQSEVLKEVKAGRYATKTIKGIPGHLYQLSIKTGANTFTASSVMPKPVKLEAVSFQKISLLGAARIFAVSNFQDPAGTENQYLFKQLVNGKDLAGTTFAFDDRLSDGKQVSESLFTDSSYIKKGDKVVIQMSCVDKKVFNYFNSLMQSESSQSPAPSNPVTNLIGKGNVLGYFSAQTISTSEAVVD